MTANASERRFRRRWAELVQHAENSVVHHIHAPTGLLQVRMLPRPNADDRNDIACHLHIGFRPLWDDCRMEFCAEFYRDDLGQRWPEPTRLNAPAHDGPRQVASIVDVVSGDREIN